MSAVSAERPTYLQLTLIRHGETSANKDKIIQGQADTSLSEHGCSQSRLAGQRVAATETISHVYSSDLARAVKTAELIVSELPGHYRITTDVRLRERGFGCMEGRPVLELVRAAERAKVSAREYTPSGGESLDALDSRVAAFLEELFKTVSKMELGNQLPLRPGGLVASPLPPPHWHELVVGHGGTLHVMTEQLRMFPGCQLPLRSAATPNTAVSSFLLTLQASTCCSVTTLTVHSTAHLTH